MEHTSGEQYRTARRRGGRWRGGRLITSEIIHMTCKMHRAYQNIRPCGLLQQKKQARLNEISEFFPFRFAYDLYKTEKLENRA